MVAMVNHVICRATGERVGCGYVTTISKYGLLYKFYNERLGDYEMLPKVVFEYRYRIEKVEYK